MPDRVDGVRVQPKHGALGALISRPVYEKAGNTGSVVAQAGRRDSSQRAPSGLGPDDQTLDCVAFRNSPPSLGRPRGPGGVQPILTGSFAVGGPEHSPPTPSEEAWRRPDPTAERDGSEVGTLRPNRRASPCGDDRTAEEGGNDDGSNQREGVGCPSLGQQPSADDAPADRGEECDGAGVVALSGNEMGRDMTDKGATKDGKRKGRLVHISSLSTPGLPGRDSDLTTVSALA